MKYSSAWFCVVGLMWACKSPSGHTLAANTADAHAASTAPSTAAPSASAPRTGASPSSLSAADSEPGRTNARMCSVAGWVNAEQLTPTKFGISREDLKAVALKIENYSRFGGRPPMLVSYRAPDGREGLRVFGVGPEATCGFKQGDFLLRVQKVPVTEMGTIAEKRQTWLAGKQVELEIERDGAPLLLTFFVREH